MADSATNAIAINAIQQELANTVLLSGLSTAQRRELMEAAFPNGAYIEASNPTVEVGDFIYGEGYEGINSGNLWFGVALTAGPKVKTGAGASQEGVDVIVKLG